MMDPNFKRSVILITEYHTDGAVGFVLNHQGDNLLGDLLPDVSYSEIPVYMGGPVAEDTLHFIHRCPEKIEGGLEIWNGIYWGGDYEELKAMAAVESNEPGVRLFQGYTGWAPGQLEREIEEGAWLIADADERLLFDTPVKEVWEKAVTLLGPKYGCLIHMPTDPLLN